MIIIRCWLCGRCCPPWSPSGPVSVGAACTPVRTGGGGEPPQLLPSGSYQDISIVISAVHAGHQRTMPDCFATPLVGVLQPGLQEVKTCSESCQHQNRHQQVEGHEPVQEQPRHDGCQGWEVGRWEGRRMDVKGWERGQREGGGIRDLEKGCHFLTSIYETLPTNQQSLGSTLFIPFWPDAAAIWKQCTMSLPVDGLDQSVPARCVDGDRVRWRAAGHETRSGRCSALTASCEAAEITAALWERQELHAASPASSPTLTWRRRGAVVAMATPLADGWGGWREWVGGKLI